MLSKNYVKRRKPLPDAIVIENRDDLLYNEILRKVKKDPTLSRLCNNTRISRKQSVSFFLNSERSSTKTRSLVQEPDVS